MFLDHLHFTVPKDYDDLLSYYTKHGYRVIAIAGKSIAGLSWLKAQRMKRFVCFRLPLELNIYVIISTIQRASRVWATFPRVNYF